MQGVFFREWTLKRAHEIGVSGWVRNLHDGRVEVYAVGDAATLARFQAELKQGSPASHVAALDVREAKLEHAEGFTRRQTV